jgi:hypothetical protein
VAGQQHGRRRGSLCIERCARSGIQLVLPKDGQARHEQKRFRAGRETSARHHNRSAANGRRFKDLVLARHRPRGSRAPRRWSRRTSGPRRRRRR